MSQKERIREMFFREVELSAIEIHLIAGISLKSTLKRIHELRMQGVITKTNRFFQARGRKYAVYKMKPDAWWSFGFENPRDFKQMMEVARRNTQEKMKLRPKMMYDYEWKRRRNEDMQQYHL